MQLRFKSNIIEQNLINVYNVYNLSLNNYNNIINKDNFDAIEQALRMQNKSIIIYNNALCRCYINAFTQYYNKRLLKSTNYNRFVICYKRDDKLINILRHKQEDKKLVKLFVN